MTSLEVLDVTRGMLWVTFVIAAPTLGVALVVGVVIGLFQALTSIQELTLTFVPKLAAVGITFWVSIAFMSESLTSFFRDELIPMIGGG